MNKEFEEDQTRPHFSWMDTYHIPQKKGTYEFEIQDWNLVPHTMGQSLVGSKFAVSEFDHWQISVFPGGMDSERNGRISVVVKNIGGENIRATCNLFVLTIAGQRESFAKSDPGHLFESGDAENNQWVVDMPVTFEETLSEFSTYIRDNTMKIIVEMTVCSSPSILSGDNTCCATNADCATLASDMKFLLNETESAGMRSDVVLSSGKENMPCHQCILSARSPVFRDMFKSPTLGIDMFFKAGKLHTSDIEPSILKEFVHFLYTDQCRFDLFKENESVMSMFEAGSRYRVWGLVSMCEKYLSDNLTTANVADILSMAQRWENPPLTANCLKFIGANAAEVMKTEGFKHLDANVCRMVVEEVTVGKEGEVGSKGIAIDGKEEAKWSREKLGRGGITDMGDEKYVPVAKQSMVPKSPALSRYDINEATVKMSKSWDKGMDDMNAALSEKKGLGKSVSIKKSLDFENEGALAEEPSDLMGPKERLATF